ncbi:MAG: DUF5672 family protein [Puia sp.]|nr:DUF5672 family protein [Puia sp.]
MNCIVVPVYKEFHLLEVKEIISLTQLYKILGRHVVCLIGPGNIGFEDYAGHAGLNGVTIKTKTFDDVFFSGLKGYNSLLMSLEFYQSFDEFDHILIYQPDAFVFRDELEYWCKKGYDYIGAPWFENFQNAGKESNIIGVGNGGFSLRKVSSFIKGVKRLHFLRRLGGFSRFLAGEAAYSILFSSVHMQEDIFWTRCMPLIRSSFSVAPVTDAVKFSFEVHPNVLFEMNNRDLPFGCHAWWRYDLDFWTPFVESYGHKL